MLLDKIYLTLSSAIEVTIECMVLAPYFLTDFHTINEVLNTMLFTFTSQNVSWYSLGWGFEPMTTRITGKCAS